MACLNARVSPALPGKSSTGKVCQGRDLQEVRRTSQLQCRGGGAGVQMLWSCRETRLLPSPTQPARGTSMISMAGTGSLVQVSGLESAHDPEHG